MKREECSRRGGKLCKSRNVEMRRFGEVKIVISRSQACKCYKWHPHWRNILTWVLSLWSGMGRGERRQLGGPRAFLSCLGKGREILSQRQGAWLWTSASLSPLRTWSWNSATNQMSFIHGSEDIYDLVRVFKKLFWSFYAWWIQQRHIGYQHWWGLTAYWPRVIRPADAQSGKSLDLALRHGLPVIRFPPRSIISLPKPCSLPSVQPRGHSSEPGDPPSPEQKWGSGECRGGWWKESIKGWTDCVFLLHSASLCLPLLWTSAPTPGAGLLQGPCPPGAQSFPFSPLGPQRGWGHGVWGYLSAFYQGDPEPLGPQNLGNIGRGEMRVLLVQFQRL